MKFYEPPTEASLRDARAKLTSTHFGDDAQSLRSLCDMLKQHDLLFYTQDPGARLGHSVVQAVVNDPAVQADWQGKLGPEKAHKIYAKNPVDISTKMAEVCAHPARVEESDNIQYQVIDEGLPDALFTDAASLGDKTVYLVIAANTKSMGGGFGWAPAQEEYLFHNTDLSLTMPTTHSYFASKTSYSVNPLTDIGATYLLENREAYYFGSHHMNHIRLGIQDHPTEGLCEFDIDGRAYLKNPALQIDAQGHIQKKPFHALFAAMPDYRRPRNSTSQPAKAHFLTEAGFKEHVQLGLVNAYQMIAQVLEHQQTTGTKEQAVIKFSPLGCGAFEGPPFLMAAIYRVAIQQARNDFATDFQALGGFPQIDFSILCRNGPHYANEGAMKDKFDEILNDRDFSDACKMLDPTSPEYQSEWKTFIEQNREWKAATQPPSASAQLSLQGKAETAAQVQTQQNAPHKLLVSPVAATAPIQTAPKSFFSRHKTEIGIISLLASTATGAGLGFAIQAGAIPMPAFVSSAVTSAFSGAAVTALAAVGIGAGAGLLLGLAVTFLIARFFGSNDDAAVAQTSAAPTDTKVLEGIASQTPPAVVKPSAGLAAVAQTSAAPTDTKVLEGGHSTANTARH